MDITKFSEWFKLSNTNLLAIVMGCSILLFASDNFLKKLGLFNIRNSYKIFIAIFLLISISILAARWCNAVLKWIQQRITWRRNLKRSQKRLHNLTAKEKEILRGYILNNTRTQDLLVQDGVVQGLVSENIIYRSANSGTMMGGFAFNIQPWAWSYLQANTKLLD